MNVKQSGKRYEIKITEIGMETRIFGKEWLEGADLDSTYEKKTGYTPEITKKVEVTRTIFLQNKDSLDLSKVIIAINDLCPTEK